MAVTKTLTKSIPHVKSSKAEKWDLEMTYENDSEGDATYYKSVFNHTAIAADGDFTRAAKMLLTPPKSLSLPDFCGFSEVLQRIEYREKITILKFEHNF